MTHDTACTCDRCRMMVMPATRTAEPTFTKEQLRSIKHDQLQEDEVWARDFPNGIAAFALLQMERAEMAEAERDEARRELAEAEEAIIRLDAIVRRVQSAGIAHLPPDGISAQEFISRVLSATDCLTQREAQSHPAVRRALERKP